MKLRALAIAALLPAALGTSPASTSGRVAVPVCTGGGAARSIELPLGPDDVPGAREAGCWVKGCHAGGARQRARGRD